MVLIVSVTIKESGNNSYRNRVGNIQYKNKVILKDTNQLALLLLDLETYGGNIIKAFNQFKKEKEDQFPW